MPCFCFLLGIGLGGRKRGFSRNLRILSEKFCKKTAFFRVDEIMCVERIDIFLLTFYKKLSTIGIKNLG